MIVSVLLAACVGHGRMTIPIARNAHSASACPALSSHFPTFNGPMVGLNMGGPGKVKTDGSAPDGSAFYQSDYTQQFMIGSQGVPLYPSSHAPKNLDRPVPVMQVINPANDITVTVDVTAQHFGFFEFSLCPNVSAYIDQIWTTPWTAPNNSDTFPPGYDPGDASGKRACKQGTPKNETDLIYTNGEMSCQDFCVARSGGCMHNRGDKTYNGQPTPYVDCRCSDGYVYLRKGCRSVVCNDDVNNATCVAVQPTPSEARWSRVYDEALKLCFADHRLPVTVAGGLNPSDFPNMKKASGSVIPENPGLWLYSQNEEYWNPDKADNQTTLIRTVNSTTVADPTKVYYNNAKVPNAGPIDFTLALPASVHNKQYPHAMLQWHWQTGNSPAAYPEMFTNVADIAIGSVFNTLDPEGSSNFACIDHSLAVTDAIDAYKLKTTFAVPPVPDPSSTGVTWGTNGRCPSAAIRTALPSIYPANHTINTTTWCFAVNRTVEGQAVRVPQYDVNCSVITNPSGGPEAACSSGLSGAAGNLTCQELRVDSACQPCINPQATIDGICPFIDGHACTIPATDPVHANLHCKGNDPNDPVNYDPLGCNVLANPGLAPPQYVCIREQTFQPYGGSNCDPKTPAAADANVSMACPGNDHACLYGDTPDTPCDPLTGIGCARPYSWKSHYCGDVLAGPTPPPTPSPTPPPTTPTPPPTTPTTPTHTPTPPPTTPTHTPTPPPTTPTHTPTPPPTTPTPPPTTPTPPPAPAPAPAPASDDKSIKYVGVAVLSVGALGLALIAAGVI